MFREFLTPPAEVAAASFLIARCAGKDKYFSVLDTIFRGQEHMYQTGDIKGALAHAASLFGLQQFGTGSGHRYRVSRTGWRHSCAPVFRSTAATDSGTSSSTPSWCLP